MTRKIRNKTNQQKKIIVKSLMSISLQVEKYIYKNRPISISQAEVHLREIKKYKSLCLQDERSLQVIEKLQRCLQSIIDEQASQSSTDFPIPCSTNSQSPLQDNQHVNNNIQSPVYSLADEDRTYMIACMNDDAVYTNISNSVNDAEGNLALTICNIDSPVITEASDKTSPARKLIEQTETEFQIIKNLAFGGPLRTESDYNIPTEVIDLTLPGEEHDTGNSMYSQSILNNIENVDCISSACGQDMLEIDNEVNKIIQNERMAEVANEKMNLKTNTVIELQDSTKNEAVTNHATGLVQEVLFDATKFSEQSIHKSKTISNKINTKDQKKVRKISINKSKSNKPKKTITLDKPSEKLVPSPKKKSKMCKENSNNKKQSSRRKSIIENGIFEKLPLEQELSWVENLKYVRKINIEEYDRSLNSLSESFWENCHLPEQWNDNDF